MVMENKWLDCKNLMVFLFRTWGDCSSICVSVSILRRNRTVGYPSNYIYLYIYLPIYHLSIYLSIYLSSVYHLSIIYLSIIYLSIIYLQRFIMRNWPMWFWRLRGPQICRLQAGGPGKPVVWFSLSVRAWKQGSQARSDEMFQLSSDAGRKRANSSCLPPPFVLFGSWTDGRMPTHTGDVSLFHWVHWFQCSSHLETASRTHPETMLNPGAPGQSSRHIKLTVTVYVLAVCLAGWSSQQRKNCLTRPSCPVNTVTVMITEYIMGTAHLLLSFLSP